jgi:aminoglycoside N3'-acetyltransferase
VRARSSSRSRSGSSSADSERPLLVELSDLVADLRALGVRDGDLVVLHASMRAIGPVEGGASTVVRALDAALGAAGTLVMVLGAEQSDAPFDALSTPADPDVGVLAEVFRRTDGTAVNDHPDGRFGARGGLARDLLAGGPWHDYYGPGSLLERVVQRRGKVLRLGADLDTVTVLHYAEYLAPLDHKRRVRRVHRLARDGGVVEQAVECLDDSDGIVDHPGEDYFAQIVRAYLATGRAATGRVGNAQSELIDAGDLVAFGVEWMATHLRGGR